MIDIKLIPGAVGEILAGTVDTGYISLSDRYGLMAAILDESLEEEETQAINRLLHFIKRGRIKW